MDKIANPSMNEVMDGILRYLEKNRGWYMPVDEIHLEVSKQVGDFFLNFVEILDDLVEEKMIRGRPIANAEKHPSGYEILPKGSKFLEQGGYAKQAKDKEDLDRLNKEKLMVDLSNAENIFKSYPMTKSLAIGGFIIALILAILKIIEALQSKG